MEDFSRRVLMALVVAAAGPAAAWLTFLVVAPSLVVATAPETDGGLVETTGSLLVGLLIGGTLAAGVAYVAAAGATWLALSATRCPRAPLAWVVCLALSPLWIGGLSGLGLDATSILALSGVLPGVVRLGFGYATPGSRNEITTPGRT